jgi:hypothetical protein
LIDPGERSLDARLLQRALALVVFQRRLPGFDRRLGLRDLCSIVVVLQTDKLVAFVYLLIVAHLHFAHDALRPSYRAA